MLGRELVQRAVLFEKPDRIPRDLPEPWGSDFLHVGIDADPDWESDIEGEDEWGWVWQKDPAGKTRGQVKTHPLTDYSLLPGYRFPNYDLPARYEGAGRKIEENISKKFVLANIPLSFIHRLEYFRGYVEAWTDPYEHPKELALLLDKMADMAVEAVQHFSARGADGIISADDWGLQDRPMISPPVFRGFFKPRYARIYEMAQKKGLLTFLHSCGHITELLDDFIDAGLQVIQMDQQENMGLEELSRRFGGRLCFWCPVDIQRTMVKGTLEDIRAYAKMLIETLGSSRGGFMAKWYSSPEDVHHSWERIAAMSEAFVEYGNYSPGKK